MKNILLVLLVFAAINFSFATDSTQHVINLSKEQNNTSKVNWLTWEQAIAKLESDASKGLKPKKIFIDVYTDWCGWCIKMDKLTFQEASISAYLNQNFYSVKLNAEQKAEISFAGKTFKFIPSGNRGYHELASALLDGKMSYPTVVFLNEKVELLQRIPGYLDIPTFDCILHYLAEDHYLTTPWGEFQNSFNASKNKGK
jgi:thioredoxin-related protein